MRGIRGGGLHDPCAVLAVTQSGLVSLTRRQVGVELAGTLTRGMTVVDQRLPVGVDDPDGNVWHGHTLDHPAALAALLDAVAGRG